MGTMETSHPVRARRWATVAGVALAALVAAGVRLLPAERVFTPDGVRFLGDGDVLYHARRVERIAADWPRVEWRDPAIDHPRGAEVPWPPGLDFAYATATVVSTRGEPSPASAARVSAIAPVVVGAAAVPAAALLALALAGSGAVISAFLMALLPIVALAGTVGRPDHHVAEVLFACAALLGYANGARPGRGGWAGSALLSAALTLAFWSWPGSSLYLIVLAAGATAVHLIQPGGPEAARYAAISLARGAGLSAILLVLSVGLLGPPGALLRMRLTPISGLSALLAAGAAAYGALLAAAAARRGGEGGARRRSIEIVLAVVLSLGPILLIPGARGGIAHGLTAAGASSAWYATIHEFAPMVGSGMLPLAAEMRRLLQFGLTLPFLPVALWILVRSWRAQPGRRQGLLLLGVWTAAFLVLAFARQRFGIYLGMMLAVAAGAAVSTAAGRIAARGPAGRSRVAPIAFGAAAVLLLIGPAYLRGFRLLPAEGLWIRPATTYLSGLRPSPGQLDGVMAPWPDGHAILHLGRHPVVATPFGTDLGPDALDDATAFFSAVDAALAEEILRRRKVGFVLIGDPLLAVAAASMLAPPGTPAPVETRSTLVDGLRYVPADSYWDTAAARLYLTDGSGSDSRREALGGYRLLFEGPRSQWVDLAREHPYKVFGVVPGARVRVRGAPAGALVSGTVSVRTNVGRVLVWRTAGPADQAGEAVLRIPWATGANGASRALPLSIEAGDRRGTVSIAEENVVRGGELRLDLR